MHAHLAIPCGRFQVPYTNVHPFIPCKYLECCRSGSVVKETLTHAAERTYRLKPFVEKTVKLLRPIAKLRFYTSQERKKKKKNLHSAPPQTNLYFVTLPLFPYLPVRKSSSSNTKEQLIRVIFLGHRAVFLHPYRKPETFHSVTRTPKSNSIIRYLLWPAARTSGS